MRKKKLLWIGVFLLIIGTVGALAGYVTLKDRDYKLLMKQIEVKSCQGIEIDQALYDKVVHKIEGKLQKNADLKPIEQFFLGYKAYFNDDYERAYAYYMPISRIKIPEEDGLANVLINKHLNRICLALNKNEEGVELTQYWAIHYEEKTVKKYVSLIIATMQELLLDSQNQDAVMKCYEMMLENNNESSVLDTSYLKYHLELSALYGNAEMYGSALELGMKTLALAELMGNDELTCMQMYQISVMHIGIGNNTEAKVWAKRCFEIKTGDSAVIANIKVALVTNYIRMLVESKEFDEVDKAISIYEENIELVQEHFASGFKTEFKMTMLQYYVAIGDEALARAQAEEVLSALQEERNGYLGYLDTMSQYILGEYYLFIGERDKGIELLTASIEGGIPTIARDSVELLLDHYIKNGDMAQVNQYTIKLKELNDDIINDTNTSYVEYANKKYEYEKKVEEMNVAQIRNYLFGFIGILLATIIIGVLWSKVHFFRSMNQLDGLTQVYNRGYFNKQYAMMKEKNRSFYLAILDIDNFKSINDTYGHIYGDYVIKNVAHLAKDIIGKAGRVYRYGGEEFVIALFETDPIQVVHYTEQVRKSIEAFKWAQDVRVTISMGVAPDLGGENDTLDLADQKLYEAKHTGKNKVCILEKSRIVEQTESGIEAWGW